MLSPSVKTETIGRGLTKTVLVDFEERIKKFKQFAHFSQFSGVGPKTTKIPQQTEVRIETSCTLRAGEIMFGINLDGSLEWLGEIIDSSD
jgi:hypothetical protein